MKLELSSEGVLDVSGTEVTEIIIDKNLSEMRALLAHNCPELKSIFFKTKCGSLEVVSCINSGLETIEFGRYVYPALSNVELDNCQLKEFKLNPKKVENMKVLSLMGNPAIENLERENYDSNWNVWDIVRVQLLSQSDRWGMEVRLPVKIVMLGNHASGKSTLVDYLVGIKKAGVEGKEEKEKESTNILRIESWDADPEDINEGWPEAIFYDFGGQDFYHGLYQAFLTPDSIHCLLWQKDSNQNIEAKDSDAQQIRNFNLNYWFGQKRYKGLAQDPMYIIQSYLGKEGTEKVGKFRPNLGIQEEIGMEFLPEKGSMWEDYQEQSLQHLRHRLKAKINQLEQPRRRAQWEIDFVDWVLKQKEDWNCTTFSEVLEAFNFKEKNESKEENLHGYLITLRNRGLILYYPEPESPNKKDKEQVVWLSPEALAKHVHEKVFHKDSSWKGKGVVPAEEFEKQVDNENLLHLLKEEKVVFLHPHNPEGTEYIIPNFLPLASGSDMSYRLSTFELSDSHLFTLDFDDFIPFGFINQLICRFGALPDAKRFWRDQMVFTISRGEGTGKKELALVQIRLDLEKMQVVVFASLKKDENSLQKGISEYLFINLMGIFSGAPTFTDYDHYLGFIENPGGFVPEKMLNDLPIMSGRSWTHSRFKKGTYSFPDSLKISLDHERFINYSELPKSPSEASGHHRINTYSLELDKNSHPKTWKPKGEIPIQAFQAFTPVPLAKSGKLFISYSSDDAKWRDLFYSNLKGLELSGEIEEIWWDDQIKTGLNYQKNILKKLEEADLVILLLSNQFWGSKYIRKYELKGIQEKFKKDEKGVLGILLKSDAYSERAVSPDPPQNKETYLGPVSCCPKWKGEGDPHGVLNIKGEKLLPVENWPNQSVAWTQVVQKVRNAINPPDGGEDYSSKKKE